jgi:hypothetical protein
MRVLGVALLVSSTGAIAQTVTGSGTSGAVPVFNGTSSVTSSPISISGSNVGIGTTNPASTLTVNGTAAANPNTGSEVPYSNTLTFQSSATFTIGTIKMVDPANSYIDNGDMTFSAGAGGAPERMRIQGYTGNVGIGTTSPSTPLEVNGGDIKLTYQAASPNNTTGIVFSDGTKQTTAFIATNCGADYAEAVDVSGDRTNYGPGDLLVIDTDAPGKFLKSNQPYSTLVSGVYSTKPGFVGRLDLAQRDRCADGHGWPRSHQGQRREWPHQSWRSARLFVHRRIRNEGH